MKPFLKVGALQPQRHQFDLSYEKKFTCNFGQLIPVMCDEVIPGDKFKLANQCVVRLQPMQAPIMHEVNVTTHYFFVPYRLLWNNNLNTAPGKSTECYDDEIGYTTMHSSTNKYVNKSSWQQFITQGKDGPSIERADESIIPRYITPLTNQNNWNNLVRKGTLWDYFGFPIFSKTITTPFSDHVGLFQNTNVNGFYSMPIVFPWGAYNYIYNEYYRDENQQSKVSLANNTVLIRNWEKDYFTSAMPWQQRGVAPALPIYGDAILYADGAPITTGTGDSSLYWYKNTSAATHNGSVNTLGEVEATTYQEGYPMKADLSTASSADIAELRLSFQIQKWMERNARAGVRMREFLLAHFGTAPNDETLQRPVYIGGTKSPVIVSQVLQNSAYGGETSNPTQLGHMAGHGITASSNYIGTYISKEFGLIMGIMSIMPRTNYQNGINRQWLRRSPYDYPFPEFAHLSEQGIEYGEIYFTGSGDYVNHTGDGEIFGYIGRFDELRFKPSLVCGDMRDTFDYWHLARKFGSRPTLGSTFLQCRFENNTGDNLNRIFAVQDEPGFIVDYANIIHAYRPIPLTGEPGLIDHN